MGKNGTRSSLVVCLAAAAALAGCGQARPQQATADRTCLTCHAAVPAGAARSSHLEAGAAPAGQCRLCHDDSQIQGVHYRLPHDPASPDAWCRACHAGQGLAVGTRTPPLLVGWTDAAAGDFHGARAGAGFGGTLEPPYSPGQGPLPCAACHASHASGNPFLLASTVNGRAVPAGAIDRAGVGGEALCTACHAGERHAGCSVSGCHGLDPQPAGSACFWCHGHEGIRFWSAPNPSMQGSWGCAHCHSAWLVAPGQAAPRFTAAPAASSITATSATVRWWTDEGATSYVEYGAGAPGWVAGDAALATQHQVTLTGLAPSTTYLWRVRSSDAFRSVSASPLQAFTTWPATAVPAPDVAPVWASATVPSTSTVATLLWYPVTAPSGSAVQYEVQLASDPGFTALASATLGAVDPALATGNSGWISGTPTHDGTLPQPRAAVGFDVTLTNLPQDDCIGVEPNVYYFRVRARDAEGTVSAWSGTGSFTAMAGDPHC